MTIPVLDPIEDLTHPSGKDPSFQESALFVWYDQECGVGGFWRLGQEPNIQELNSCFGVFTRSGLRFRSNVTGFPLAKSDRGEAHMACGESLRIDLDALTITAKFPELEATLRFTDFFPRYDWFTLLKRPRAPSEHFEVAGRIEGWVRIDNEEFELNALGYRDRSWGPRQWGGMRGTRWWPMVFGEDLCIFLSASVHEPSNYGAYGYMIRDGRPLTLYDVDIGAMLDSDAISPRAGVGQFLLGDEGRAEVTHQRADGVLLHCRGYSSVESIGTAHFRGRVGFSNLEVASNALGGSKLPILTLGANSKDGLSRRKE